MAYGWVSLPYAPIEPTEFMFKGLSYMVLGGIFGDCIHYIIKDVIKEIKG